MIYYTSDLHFGHTNILKYEKSPFKTIEERDLTIIKNINERCNEDDVLYIIGDIALKYSKYVSDLIKLIKPHKWLIKGNHDRVFLKGLRKVEVPTFTISDYEVIDDNGRNVVLFHYPIFNWDGQKYGYYHIYGHVHDKPQFQLNVKNSFNAYIKLHNYYPVTLDELINQDDISNLKINKNA